MSISIDMLDVENADAIIVWLKDGDKNLTMIIDAGYKDDGQKVIDHFEYYIKPYTNKAPNIIISTHSDNDHIGGLEKIIEYYGNEIDAVLIHDVNNHKIDILNSFKNLSPINFAFETYEQRKNRENKKTKLLLESSKQSIELNNIIHNLRIKKYEPFQSKPIKFGNYNITIVSPSKEFYYKKMYPKEMENLFHLAFQDINESEEIVNEALECNTLDKNSSTSNNNDVSVVLLIENTITNEKYLFTGDAGVEALNEAKDFADLSNLTWLKIPHHGSKGNLTSDLIEHFSPKVAYISAKGNRKHPSRALINCLKKQNVAVISTHKHKNIWYKKGDFEDREEYSVIEESL